MNNKKSGWFSRLRASIIPVTSKNATPLYGNAGDVVFLNTEQQDNRVTAETAMSLDAVWACVRLIAESIAMMPLNVYTRDDIDPRIAKKHSLNSLLSISPNSRSTAAVFWEAVVSAMLLRGNAFIRVYRYNGSISSLVFMSPDRLTVTQDFNYKKRYMYREDSGKIVEVPADQVWQLQGYSLDGRDGCSVIEYATNMLGTALAAEKSASKTFLNGMLQAIYYTVSTFLTNEQRDGFRKHVRGTVERGEAPILEGGVDVKSLGVKPSDAQLLESRAYSVDSICRWFRVPPSMVGNTAKANAWGTGIEQQILGYLTFTLTPWLHRIEQGVEASLFTDLERIRYKVRFDTSALARTDSAARASYYSTMVAAGNMTRDEVRRAEGLPLLGGNANKLTVQGAMVLLDSLQKVSSNPEATGSFTKNEVLDTQGKET